MPPYHAAIRGQVRNIKWMFRRAGAIGRSESGSTIHLVVQSNSLHTFSQYPPPMEAYCSFNDAFLDGITLSSDRSVETVVSVITLLNALRTFYDDDFVELRFVKELIDERYRIPVIYICQDSLKYRVLSGRPTEEEQDVQDTLITRFDDSEALVTKRTANSFVQSSEKLRSSFDALDDGQGRSRYTFVSGNENTKGHYHRGIRKCLTGLPGELTLYVDRDDSTLAVVSTDKAGCVFRYIAPSLDINEAN